MHRSSASEVSRDIEAGGKWVFESYRTKGLTILKVFREKVRAAVAPYRSAEKSIEELNLMQLMVLHGTEEIFFRRRSDFKRGTNCPHYIKGDGSGQDLLARRLPVELIQALERDDA